MDLRDVEQRIKRRNQILFSRDSLCLQPLQACMARQNHRTLVLWALECAKTPAEFLTARYPQDLRPQRALEQSWQWARGKSKMPQARQAILQVHAMAKGLSDRADIARCHAVGQACATVHTPRHAIGLPVYELTALVRECGLEQGQERVAQRIGEYMAALERCAQQEKLPGQNWSSFLANGPK